MPAPATTRTSEPANSDEPTASPEIQLVVCVVAGERYGIGVERVHEIIRLPAITPLPGADRAISGVINLRGRIVPVMDLRERFGLAVTPTTRLSRIVVADGGGTQVGLIVDGVEEVVRMPRSGIDPIPAISSATPADHMTGVARSTDGLIVLLDLDRIVTAGVAATPLPTDAVAPA